MISQHRQGNDPAGWRESSDGLDVLTTIWGDLSVRQNDMWPYPEEFLNSTLPIHGFGDLQA